MWRWAPRRSGPVQVPVVLREPVTERAPAPAAALEPEGRRTAVRNIVARPPEAQNIAVRNIVARPPEAQNIAVLIPAVLRTAVLLPEVQHTAACRSWLRLQPI